MTTGVSGRAHASDSASRERKSSKEGVKPVSALSASSASIVCVSLRCDANRINASYSSWNGCMPWAAKSLYSPTHPYSSPCAMRYNARSLTRARGISMYNSGSVGSGLGSEV